MVLLKPVFPVIDYIVNYDYIAKELCENKAKPMLHCNGKCHLKKELARAANDNKSSQEKKAFSGEAEFILPLVPDFTPLIAVVAGARGYISCPDLYKGRNIAAVFHPPLVIC